MPDLREPIGKAPGAERPLDAPKGADYDLENVRAALLKGSSVRQAARETGASIGTVAGVRKALGAQLA